MFRAKNFEDILESKLLRLEKICEVRDERGRCEASAFFMW